MDTDNNNDFLSENHGDYDHSTTPNNQLENMTSTSLVVDEVDELLLEIDNRYKTLASSIVDARQSCNKLKAKKAHCKKRIEEQEFVIQELKSHYSVINPQSSSEDLDSEISGHQRDISQLHCGHITEYAEKISREIGSDPDHISALIQSVREELTAIESRTQMITALQELNRLYQSYKQLQQHGEAAEKRFQNMLAIFGDKSIF